MLHFVSLFKSMSVYEPSKKKLSKVGFAILYSQLLKIRSNKNRRKLNSLNLIKSLESKYNFFLDTETFESTFLPY